MLPTDTKVVSKVKRYCLTYRPDDLKIVEETEGVSIPVRKRGAARALGQLFSRQFAVCAQGGDELFRVVDGNSGTLPRASLKMGGREVFVLTAGGGCFGVRCSVRGTDYSFAGDPFSDGFVIEASGRAVTEVSVVRGSGRQVYSFSLEDGEDGVTVLAIVATLAVFRGRTVPCVEPVAE